MKGWTPEQVQFVIDQRAKNVKIDAIAKSLDKSYDSVSNKLKGLVCSGKVNRIGHVSPSSLRNVADKYVPAVQPNYDQFFKLKGDAMVISDVHVPFHHIELIELLMKVAIKFKVKTLIIPGDFLNGDAFSRFATGFRGEVNQEIEFNDADYILTKLLKVFDRIVWTTGNHEDRYYKAFGGSIPHVRFLNMINDQITSNLDDKKRIKVSNYPYSELNESWLIGHPQNFGSSGGTVPARIADKYEKNIICGHNHQFGMQMSMSGKYIGIDHGCGADPLKIEYYMKGFNTYRTWQNGFTMILNNKPYVFNLKMTDWNWWLK